MSRVMHRLLLCSRHPRAQADKRPKTHENLTNSPRLHDYHLHAVVCDYFQLSAVIDSSTENRTFFFLDVLICPDIEPLRVPTLINQLSDYTQYLQSILIFFF